MCQSIRQTRHFKYGGNKDPEGFISKGKKTKNLKCSISSSVFLSFTYNIINAYLLLLTRGMYGTYIYAVDKNLRDYIKSLIDKGVN